MKYTLFAGLVLMGTIAQAQPGSEMRARLRGGGGPDGKCTIEVEVDAAAEVQINGDVARIRTLSGGPAVMRRFECSSPMPNHMADFRYSGVDGRGRQYLVRDPRQNRGVAVIRIEDTQGGREGYTFDVEWRGAGSFSGGYPGGGPGPYDRPGGYGDRPPTRFTAERAIAICKESVVQRLERDGYRRINFERVIPDDNPGRRDWIVGSVDGRRRGDFDRFSFSCSVDFSSGRVRDVQLRPRR